MTGNDQELQGLTQRLAALEQGLAVMARNLRQELAATQQQLHTELRSAAAGTGHCVPSVHQAKYLSAHARLQLFGTARVLDRMDFQPPVYLYDASVADAALGAWTYVSAGAHVAGADIGSYCAIGERTVLAATRPQPRNALCSSALMHEVLLLDGRGLQAADADPPPLPRICLGHDVSIGSGCCICPDRGLSIGTGVIIEDATVLRGITEIAPYSIVAGNPGRVIGRRFDEHTVSALLESRWWEYDWPAIMGMPQHAGRFALHDAAACLESLSGCDTRQLPRLEARRHQVTAAGAVITLDGLRIMP